MPAHAAEQMTSEAFLAWAEGREGRWEFVQGVPVAMAGAQERHDQVVVNALTSLRPQVRGTGCRVFTSDTAVVVPNGSVRRPDLGVDCGKRRPEALSASAPKLLIEVLSPSTRQIDQLIELDEYRAIDTMTNILIVDPAILQTALWSRVEGSWTSQVFEQIDDRISFGDLGLSITMAELYEDVSLPPRLVSSSA